jgi:hypothetical protein
MPNETVYKYMNREALAAHAVLESGVDLAKPVTTLKNAMMSVRTDHELHKGITVQRITSYKGIWKTRMITLSSDNLAFFITHNQLQDNLQSQLSSVLPIPLWTPSKGFHLTNDGHRYIRHLDIADIDYWQVGVIGTMTLENAMDEMSELDIQEIVTIFHHGSKNISFRISNQNQRNIFLHTIRQMKDRYNLITSWISNEQLLLRYINYDIDVDQNERVSSQEFEEICKRINLVLPNRDQIFAEYAKTSSSKGCSSNEITGTETRELLHSISLRDLPASKLWDQVFGKDVHYVGPGQFREDFLLPIQGEMNTSLDDADLLVQSLKTMGYSKDDAKTISKAEFVAFLHTKYNNAYNPIAMTEPTTKLDKPLSYYWINTSHNTYLTGDQLQSRSSVQAYVNALNRGCKCLELDCWDGVESKKLKKFVPVVYHGHTLTTKVDFQSICCVVDNYLNENPTSYPIILSLESHCSPPYQRSLADTMKETFGKKLFIPSNKQTSGENLPSPEELRGMVVIKGKRPPDPDEEDASITNKNETGKLPSSTDHNEIDDYDQALEKPKKSKIDPELARLTLFHGCKYKSFATSVSQPPSHMHSIGETKIKKILEKSIDNAKLWRKYNISHLTRTYPAGSRVDSSNYNPVLAWSMGCQLVALNFQTPDTPLILNDGMFRRNGGCGYIEKPVSIMGGARSNKMTLKVSILSAHCLPKPMGAKDGELVDPYISVEVHDVCIASDSEKEEYVATTSQTSAVENNGFCPVWTDANFTFKVHTPDVAMLMFKIIDDDYGYDDIIASSAIPFSCLRQGYRIVQLYDQNNTRTGPFQYSNLFVKISIDNI